MKNIVIKKMRLIALFICSCFLVNQMHAEMPKTTEPAPAERTAKDFRAVAKSATPAVVFIKVKTEGEEDMNRNSQQPALGQATGFIISPDGYIFTNCHVVEKTKNIKVIMNDGREFNAKVIGADHNTDIAMIKIASDKPLPYVSLANSEGIEIGEWAIAIGNPLGLQASLTVGVISAKGRNNLDIANVEDFIQTDAAINRGNSGGPLLNIDGKVIGMNTAIVSDTNTGGYMGIGFAIPSNMLQNVKDQLLKNGKVTRGFIGVALQNIDQDLAQAFGLKQASGAIVSDVTRGSPAAKAGLKRGDVIQELNNQSVTNMSSFRNTVSLMSPGTKMNLTILRNGQKLEIPMEVGCFPDKREIASNISNRLGLEVQDITPEIAQNLGLFDEAGVIISKVDPNGVAAWEGLRKGAVISEVNQKKVTSSDQFYEQLKEIPGGRPILLLVKQGEATKFISLKMQ